MKLLLLSAQLLLVLFKLQDAIHWSWLVVLIPVQLLAINTLLHVAVFVYVYFAEVRRLKSLTPGERAAENLARSLRNLSSKF